VHVLGKERTNLVEVCGQPTKLQQLVLLQYRGQPRDIKVVVRVDRIPECLVILLLDEEFVVRLIDRFKVVLRKTNMLSTTVKTV
jgi:hypothetical protein